GKYPVLAVQTLDKIARHMEQECLQPGMQGVYSRPFQPGGQPIANAISKAVSDVASELSAGAILTLTKTGATARNVSKFRPRTPIIAVTPHIEVARQLQLVWGVRPLLVLELPTAGQTFQVAMAMAQERGWLKEGDLVVMTAGTLPGVPGSTDLIKVGMVSAQLAQGIGVGQGLVSGRARVLRPRERLTDFQTGEILVAHQTDASLVEPMRRAAGIITEDESLTGHAAVIGLRLGVPVIVGIKNATQLIRDGAIVTLDVPRGLVYAGALRIGEMG
ncbi:MAG: pyruvate kinase alpha/beta domain-containing protein, partial [Gloeomargarita sp. SKYBB_i_bin120]|nr:PEP-utilizing enzyme [Gloeomargarita sp. SKYB120]MDW8179082.1 pyruvate kinase alpha/beta domain-containing protein [Gloeomargarita sp. SKYBB_i_bin120]